MIIFCVLLEYPPRIDDRVESTIESEEGNYATLTCIAFGNPKPVITWQKGVDIVSTEKNFDPGS